MPLNKKRTIRLNDPQLIKIRNNLRSLIDAECSARKREISEQQMKIIEGGKRNQTNIRKLEEQWNKIEIPLRASIIKCPACFSSKKDMTYNPNTKMWYCTSCYKIMQEYNDVEMDGEIVNFP